MKKYSYTRTIRLPWRWSVIVRREARPGAGAGKIPAWDMEQTAQADTPPAAEPPHRRLQDGEV